MTISMPEQFADDQLTAEVAQDKSFGSQVPVEFADNQNDFFGQVQLDTSPAQQKAQDISQESEGDSDLPDIIKLLQRRSKTIIDGASIFIPDSLLAKVGILPISEEQEETKEVNRSQSFQEKEILVSISQEEQKKRATVIEDYW